MGNFHCISSSCATVVYREYLPPRVRWRYQGEAWQEITANDYSTEYESNPVEGATDRKFYDFYAKFIVQGSNHYAYNDGDLGYAKSSGSVQAPIYDLSFRPSAVEVLFELVETRNNNGICFKQTVRPTALALAGNQAFRIITADSTSREVGMVESIGFFDFSFIENTDNTPQPCNNTIPNNCIFTITLNDEIVYQETRDTCPEVEILPCRLSDIRKEIKIGKIPYLERIEVVPYGYQNLGLAVYQAIIPDECLNIYKNETVTIIPQVEGFPTPTNSAQSTYGYITQICSPEGCPPPEYQVICNCDDCESCPENTCSVECEGNICCYDKTTGKSIKSIPIDNYCGE